MHAFLLAGMSLNKFAAFRELLEEHAYQLSDRYHMLDLVPFILTQEKRKSKKKLLANQFLLYKQLVKIFWFWMVYSIANDSTAGASC